MRRITADYAFTKYRKGSKYLFKSYNIASKRTDGHWDYNSLLKFKQNLAESKFHQFRYKMTCFGISCNKCDHKFFCSFLLDEDGCI